MVFLLFCGGDLEFFGVVSRFGGYFFRAMRPLFRAQRENFFELIFRNGAEQNGGLPPCELPYEMTARSKNSLPCFAGGPHNSLCVVCWLCSAMPFLLGDLSGEFW